MELDSIWFDCYEQNKNSLDSFGLAPNRFGANKQANSFRCIRSFISNRFQLLVAFRHRTIGNDRRRR